MMELTIKHSTENIKLHILLVTTIPELSQECIVLNNADRGLPYQPT